MIIWWLLRKLFGIKHPSYYIGGLTNLEIDDELDEESEKESQAA
jgi:hypothetical protein